jgi:hypothetical protein
VHDRLREMTHELAEELKDAGFPQPALDFKGEFLFAEYGEPVDTQAYAPTLSELIEACGTNFGALVRLSNGTWNAATPVIDNGMSYGNPSTEVECSTPEEAVARLWLALSKKV